MDAPSAPTASARPAGGAPKDGAAAGAARAESPLDWLARRTDKAGRPLVDPVQRLAGERLRTDFTRAGLTPSVTTRWDASGVRGSAPDAFPDLVLAAKARVAQALAAVGPELSGVLLDVCCFLKGLEQVERERAWPARTAKVVLGLGLDRLARHYGLERSVAGRARTAMRAWRAPQSGSPEEEPRG
ncbi:DUF6456 domain-containing protein [Xanthobacter pseudotagetidis]|uniref:DUF6456 domain-containing protein n=1 Tax=Xanthobacter pseudotagetidis TaxID=3119911 RepID=UPI0037278AB9